jgi:hypothetical protein
MLGWGLVALVLFRLQILVQIFLVKNGILRFYYYGPNINANNLIYNVANDKNLRDSVTIQERKDKNEIELEIEHSVFIIDKKRGVISKKISRSWGKNEDVYESDIIVAENYISKNGWMFPLQFRYYSAPMDGENAKSQRRIVIEKESLEINKKYPLSDFLVKIPAGTRVRDNINNLEFRAGQETRSLDAELIEKQLLQLVEKKKEAGAAQK